VAALIAVRADEALGEDAATQVVAKLVLHVPRKRSVIGFARVGEECCEVLANEVVE
jgi:hypothetical protein